MLPMPPDTWVPQASWLLVRWRAEEALSPSTPAGGLETAVCLKAQGINER